MTGSLSNVLHTGAAGVFEIDQSVASVPVANESNNTRSRRTALLPSSKRYQQRDQDKGEQRREQSWREDTGTTLIDTIYCLPLFNIHGWLWYSKYLVFGPCWRWY